MNSQDFTKEFPELAKEVYGNIAVSFNGVINVTDIFYQQNLETVFFTNEFNGVSGVWCYTAGEIYGLYDDGKFRERNAKTDVNRILVSNSLDFVNHVERATEGYTKLVIDFKEHSK